MKARRLVGALLLSGLAALAAPSLAEASPRRGPGGGHHGYARPYRPAYGYSAPRYYGPRHHAPRYYYAPPYRAYYPGPYYYDAYPHAYPYAYPYPPPPPGYYRPGFSIRLGFGW